MIRASITSQKSPIRLQTTAMKAIENARHQFSRRKTRDIERRADRSADPRIQVMEILQRDWLSIEPEIGRKRFVGYRYLSAVEATQCFADAYEHVYKTYWERCVDEATKDSRRPFKKRIWYLNDTRTAANLWSVRQCVDELGMPYEFYLSHAFDYLTSAADRKKLPRPNQVIGDKVVDHVKHKWEKRSEDQSISRYLTDQRFDSANFRGDPPQLEVIDGVVDRIRKKGNHKDTFTIGLAINSSRLLPRHLAEAEFGKDVVDRIEDEMALPTRTGGSLDAYQPSCFGLPGAQDESNEICKSCAFLELCRNKVKELRASFHPAWGTDDPHGERKRFAARERQRRCRERKRAQKLVSKKM